jgi:glucokinase
VDIGGTNIVSASSRWTAASRSALHTLPTEARRGSDFVVRRVAAMVQDADRGHARAARGTRDGRRGRGIGSPGPLDRERGLVLNTPNLGWTNLPLRDLVSDAVRLPRDARQRRELRDLRRVVARRGAGREPLVGITLGTGIGGGIVLDGEIVHGASDAAGEIGHMTIEFTGRSANAATTAASRPTAPARTSRRARARGSRRATSRCSPSWSAASSTGSRRRPSTRRAC